MNHQIEISKGTDRYIFRYDETGVPALLQTFGRFAVDPELSFCWYDAAVLSSQVRRLASKHKKPRERI